MQLKSRLDPLDSNSKLNSSILIRNDYLKSPGKRTTKPKEVSAVNQMMSKLSATILKNKESDATFVEPPLIRKRERLRTSAYKGNFEGSSDEDPPDCTRRSSVSRGSSDESQETESKPNIRERMKQIIAAEKCKQAKSRATAPGASSNPPAVEVKRGRQPKAFVENLNVEKKVFVQEPLEDAIEELVPYVDIVQSIKASTPAKKLGRRDQNSVRETEKKMESDTKALQGLKFFRCGSCQHDVAKHKWMEHFLEHGGIAWIDGFEPPIALTDWNEALRRCLNNYKIYNLTSFTCPNCEQEKKSAMGHLSHLLVCGETEATIESRKIQCELCSERFLPFHSSAHKSKCSGYRKVKEEAYELVRSASSGSEDENDVSPSAFNSSGRRKRKAVQR